MDQELKNKYTEMGINVDEAMGRLMNNEGLLTKFLGKFKNSDSFDNLKKAIADGDNEAALLHSHTLKGVCGNLSMTKLYALFSEQVNLYRAGKPDEANAMMGEIEEAYKKIVDNL